MSDPVAGVVLCGGRSARMGRDKALLPWGDRPLIAHVVAGLGKIAKQVVVVSSQELELPELPARVVVDREPALGPLGGIREGLHAVDAELALVASVDSPFVDESFVNALLIHQATAACDVDGYVQPFPAIYETKLAPVADMLIAAGKMRPPHLLEAAGFRRVDGARWAARGVFKSFNTPGDYLDAVRREYPAAKVSIELAGSSPIEAAPGKLGELLAALDTGLELILEGALSPRFVATLDGVPIEGGAELPVGPGETLRVCDAG